MSYSRYGRGPSSLTITLIGVALVFGGYLLWTGFIEWMDTNTQAARDQDATLAARSTATADYVFSRPTVALFPTPTPIPTCEYYYVKGPQAAWVRECPSTTCTEITYIDPKVNVCVIGRANTDEYLDSQEWFEVLLEPDDIFPEITYMHQTVLESRNPTATPGPTQEPFPTITRTPTPTQGPIGTARPTASPSPAATAVRIEF